MYQIRRKLFSQNFLQDRKLVAQLLGRSSIGKQDLVLEIGPGKGIITEALLRQAGHVLAVELDTYWYLYLKKKFSHASHLTLYHNDIFIQKLPSLPYKVFANPPFAIEGKLIRFLLGAKRPPEDCYLVIRQDLAERLSAKYHETMFSVIHKPWFEFSIVHYFKGHDFAPSTQVRAVLFRIKKKQVPLLPNNETVRYTAFIQGAYKNGSSVYSNIKKGYGKERTRRLLRELGLGTLIKPSEISLDQWLLLYKKIRGLY